LAAIGLDGVPFQQLYVVIERGLRFWNRELLTISVGRGFLVTLACEGGLPLRLVRKDGNRLRSYFRALLEEFRIHRRAGRDPEWLAERASQYLPGNLRQKVVYAISGQLISQIWDLQAKAGDASDPVATLDRVDPGWRDRLPLRIEDETAEALLKNLVEEASRLAAAEPTQISVVRRLHKILSGWGLSAEVDLPGVTPASDLTRLLEQHDETDLGSRLELYALDQADIPHLLAYASQRVRGGVAEYLLEKPGRSALILRGAVAATELRIVAAAGSERTAARVLPQGGGLSSLPWVFVSSADIDDPKLVGQGSVRTRYPDAWVAALDSSSPEPEENSSCEPVGRMDGFGRCVYRITGNVRFYDSEGTFCVVRTEQVTEDGPEYLLAGDEVRVNAEVPVYAASLKLWCFETSGGRAQQIPLGALEWRPAGKGQWASGSPGSFGLVDIRHAVDGELRFRGRIGIVPPGLSVSWEHGDTYQAGTIALDGLEGGAVGWGDIPGVTIEPTASGETGTSKVGLRIRADSEPPANLSLILAWPGGADLEIVVPFPAKGARFLTSDGRALANGTAVAFRQLAGIRALATSTRARDKFVVAGKLLAEDASPGLTKVGIWEPLLQSDGVARLDLSYLAEQFSHLFSASRQLDAHINLRIEDAHGPTPADRRLDIRRFDLEFEPDRVESVVRLVASSAEIVTPEHAAGFKVEARALWDPNREPIALVLEPAGSTNPEIRWRIDEATMEPGPWLIIGWEGSWCRFRPLLWTIGDIPENALDDFIESGVMGDALRIPDPKQRRKAIDAAFRFLDETPKDPNWGLLGEYFTAFQGLPAASLDLFGRLAANPRVAAGLLMRADDSQFDIVWERLDEVPFSWQLVPVEAWVQAAAGLVSHYREQLAGFPGDIEPLIQQVFRTFAERLPEKLEPLALIPDLLTELDVVPGLARKSGLLGLAGSEQGAAILQQRLNEARQDLLRAQADVQWPQGNEIGCWATGNDELVTKFEGVWLEPPMGVRFRADVLHAPVIAALTSAFDCPTTADLVWEIKRLRRFNERWFDTAYSITLALAIGQMLKN
jgi:hypothetical protein